MSIHARLNNAIRKSGGYSQVYAARNLMNLFNIDNFYIAYEIAEDQEEISNVTEENLNECISRAKKRMWEKDLKFASIMSLISQ